MERKRHTKIKKILPEELYATQKLPFLTFIKKICLVENFNFALSYSNALSYRVKKVGGHRAKSQVISARS